MHTPLSHWNASSRPWQDIARQVNRIIDQINTNSGLSAGGTTSISRVSGAGTALIQHRQRSAGGFIVKLTAVETGEGKYAGRIFSPNCQTSPSANLAMPEGLADSGNTNALVLNLLESAPNGTHLLALNSFHIGLLAGYTAESTPRAVLLIAAAGAGLFPVQIEKDGGADGTPTAPATWTYTVRTLDGSQTLGTLVSVGRPRPNGSRIVQTASPAYGTAFYSSGSLLLWDAGEIAATTACS